MVRKEDDSIVYVARKKNYLNDCYRVLYEPLTLMVPLTLVVSLTLATNRDTKQERT
jgi:hypothetical protein